MIKTLCATLLLLCSSTLDNWDFSYSNNKEFIQGVTDCTIKFNSYIPPQNRSVIVISVAQAIHESDWGNSRFAIQGNNFYGMIETYSSKPHIKANQSPVMLKKYDKKCGSVVDYISLLNNGTDFVEYRKIRFKHQTTEKIDLNELIDTLHTFALDPKYVNKIKTTVKFLLNKYPDIFLDKKGLKV